VASLAKKVVPAAAKPPVKKAPTNPLRRFPPVAKMAAPKIAVPVPKKAAPETSVAATAKAAAAKQERPITVHDVNRCRIGRTALARYFEYPEFEVVVTGSFVRVCMQENVYQMAQVEGITSVFPFWYHNQLIIA
jgi:hypothetical protein